jgi:hypothetical protein
VCTLINLDRATHRQDASRSLVLWYRTVPRTSARFSSSGRTPGGDNTQKLITERQHSIFYCCTQIIGIAPLIVMREHTCCRYVMGKIAALHCQLQGSEPGVKKCVVRACVRTYSRRSKYPILTTRGTTSCPHIASHADCDFSSIVTGSVLLADRDPVIITVSLTRRCPLKLC